MKKLCDFLIFAGQQTTVLTPGFCNVDWRYKQPHAKEKTTNYK